MNIKIKAALETAFIFATMIVAVYIFQFFVEYFTAEQIKTAFGLGTIIFCSYLIYSLRLSELETRKVLDKLDNKN